MKQENGPWILVEEIENGALKMTTYFVGKFLVTEIITGMADNTPDCLF